MMIFKASRFFLPCQHSIHHIFLVLNFLFPLNYIFFCFCMVHSFPFFGRTDYVCKYFLHLLLLHCLQYEQEDLGLESLACAVSLVCTAHGKRVALGWILETPQSSTTGILVMADSLGHHVHLRVKVSRTQPL